MSAHATRLYHKLQLAAHRLQKAADRVVEEAARLSTAQAAVLAVIAAAQPTTQRQVALQLGLNESAIAAMSAKLIAAGLVRREPDPLDARAWRLTLTGAGRTALKRVQGPFEHINATIDATLSAQQITLMADALERLAEAFDPHARPKP